MAIRKRNLQRTDLHAREVPALIKSRVPVLNEAVEDLATCTQGVLLDFQCDQISDDCVKRITGSTRSYSRDTPLQEYGVNSTGQCIAIVGFIVSDSTIGVGRYQFKIYDPLQLQSLSPGWTMGNLADAVQNSAVPI